MSVPSYLANAEQGAEEVFAVSVRQFWEMSKAEGFPTARRLGVRSIRWVRSELEEYAASLPSALRNEPPQLSAARAAKAAGLPPAPAPFSGSVA